MKTICIKQVALRLEGYNDLIAWNEASDNHIIAVKGERKLPDGETYEYGESKWCNEDNLSIPIYYDFIVETMDREEVKAELTGKVLGCFCSELMLPTPNFNQYTCHVHAIQRFIEDIPVLPEPDYDEVLAYDEELGWIGLYKVRDTEKMVMFRSKEELCVKGKTTDKPNLQEFIDEFDEYFQRDNEHFVEEADQLKLDQLRAEFKEYLIDRHVVDKHEHLETKMSKTVLHRGHGSGRWRYVIPQNHVEYTSYTDIV